MLTATTVITGIGSDGNADGDSGDGEDEIVVSIKPPVEGTGGGLAGSGTTSGGNTTGTDLPGDGFEGDITDETAADDFNQELVPSDGMMMLTCRSHSDCDTDQICVNQVCAAKCENSDSCAPHQVRHRDL